MTAIEARTQNMALVAVTFDREQLDLIKTQIAPGASDGELALFVQQAKRTGLDPFSRQIYAVMREQSIKDGNQWTKVQKMTIQVAIDGFRLIAERTGKYAGQVGPEWCGADGKWVDVWLKKEAPHAARVGVLRSDFKEPLYGVARFDAYASRKADGTPISLWAKMPDVMIAKCAEAQALRRAFPNDLSGLYATEEMQQADNPAPAPQQAPARPVDVTRQIAQEVNPNAALEAWVRKVQDTAERVRSLSGGGSVLSTLDNYTGWETDISMARSAYAALKQLGQTLAAAPAEDTPPFDVVQAETILTEGQRKALCAHAGRAGAKTSEDRAALWGYSLNSVKPEGTLTLTAEQAHVLLDTFSGLDISGAEQMLAEACRAFKPATEAQS